MVTFVRVTGRHEITDLSQTVLSVSVRLDVIQIVDRPRLLDGAETGHGRSNVTQNALSFGERTRFHLFAVQGASSSLSYHMTLRLCFR
jgi:hypothetical protein